MFAPSIGIIEDPAPGSAGGPIGSYLVRHKAIEIKPTTRIINEMGFEIERPSIMDIEIDVKNDEITDVRVGGGVILVSEGTLYMEGK
jgi:trans-2,3-dihydro-3-hydroxyanthranilate isomerase